VVKLAYGYDKAYDPSKIARAMGRELRVSPKDAAEVCRQIRGKPLEKALDYLERVIEGKQAVPYKRYYRKLAHQKSLQGWHSGRYPVKACEAIIEVLENARNNAKYKGLDEDSLFVRHISVRKGFTIRGFRHRARGRVVEFNTPTTNIEVWLGERHG